jgi:ADP-ribose pyrophosphatase YjhB (NUDIX family)
MLTFGVNVIILQDNQVLLLLRSDLPVWCLPGGAIEAGESLKAEEAGVEVDISRIVGIYSRPYWMHGGNHEVVFLGRQIGGHLHAQDGEATAVSYFYVDALPNNLLWWHRERIFDAFQTAHTVARVQDVRWPLEDITYEEAKQLVSDSSLSADEIVLYFCQKPAEGSSLLELGQYS